MSSVTAAAAGVKYGEGRGRGQKLLCTVMTLCGMGTMLSKFILIPCGDITYMTMTILKCWHILCDGINI